METNYVRLVGILLLVLVVVDCSDNDLKRNVDEETGLDQNVQGKADPVQEKVGTVNDDGVKDQTDGSEGNVDSDGSRRNSDEQSGSNSNEDESFVKERSSAEAERKLNGGEDDGGNQIDVYEGDFNSDAGKSNLDEQSGSRERDNVDNGQQDSDDSVDTKEVSKEEGSVQSSPPPPLTNDDFRVEDCDPSNMCMNKRFAACLRVPGNDSSDQLLLQIQNMGKGPLTLNISAPASVQFEETDVELNENQDRKVKISITSSGGGNLIVVKDGIGEEECSLDFKDLIAHNTTKSYVTIVAFIFAAAMLVLASSWMCNRFRWRQLVRTGSKYRRLDMELPVSRNARREPVVNDGWDKGWGDNWDDEEAPAVTPSPLTPSVSSKGLASRRLSKEAWKD